MPALISTVLIVLAFWLLLIRPQRRRMMEHARILAGLEIGHSVVTAGGIHGEIRSLGDDVVQLEVAPGTVVRVERRAVTRDLDRADHPGGGPPGEGPE